MSFILVDTANDENDFQINSWNWRTIVMLLEKHSAFDAEKLELMGTSCGYPTLSKEEADHLASVLRTKVFPGLADDDRLMIDGTITKTPDDGTFYRDPAEWHKNYSTTKAMMLRLREFCDNSSGFDVL
jgi:hypothetical protein